MGGEVTAGQPLDLEAELAQSFLREIDLPMFKGIFVAAAHEKREPIAVRLEEVAEIEAITLRFVISYEARRGGEIEQPIMAVHCVVKLAEFGLRDVIVLGPQLPDSWQPLEQREGTAHARASLVRETAQQRRGIPRVGVPVRKEAAIEDENPAYLRPIRGFASIRVLKPTSQYLQNDKRGKVEGDQPRGMNTEAAPDRFDEIGALGRGVGVVLGLVAIAHTDVVEEEFRHLGTVR